MGWSQIVTALLAVLSGKLPSWVLALLKSWLGTLTPPTVSANVGDAPGVLKDMVRKFLLLNVAAIKMPFVRLILTKVVQSLSDVVLDQVWNLLVPNKAVPIAVQATDTVDYDAVATEFATAA